MGGGGKTTTTTTPSLAPEFQPLIRQSAEQVMALQKLFAPEAFLRPPMLPVPPMTPAQEALLNLVLSPEFMAPAAAAFAFGMSGGFAPLLGIERTFPPFTVDFSQLPFGLRPLPPPPPPLDLSAVLAFNPLQPAAGSPAGPAAGAPPPPGPMTGSDLHVVSQPPYILYVDSQGNVVFRQFAGDLWA